MDRKIDLNNLKTYLEACDNIGEKGVVNILKNLIKKDKDSIKKFIVNSVCEEFNVSYNELFKKRYRSKKYCLIAIVFLLKKYLDYNNNELCLIFHFTKVRRIEQIDKESKELDYNIKEHRITLDNIKIIEDKLLNFLKN